MDTITYLVNKGIDKGACVDGIKELERSDADGTSLAALFFKHAHWCLNECFPAVDWIEKTFGDKLSERGIMIHDGDVSNLRRVAMLRDINVNANYDGWHVAKIYVKGQSHLAIDVKEHAVVYIDAFDTSIVTVHASGNARVYVSQYGFSTIAKKTCDDARVQIDLKPTNKY